MAELQPGKLLIGTRGATQVLDELTGKYDEPFPFLAKRDVFDVFRDHAGRTWLGSDLGIYRLRRGLKGAQRLLPGEGVHRFLDDPSGAVWGLTQNKLMHIGDANDSAGVQFGNPDLVRYAESLGAIGMRVDHPSDLRQVMEKASNTPGVVVVDMPVDYSRNIEIGQHVLPNAWD